MMTIRNILIDPYFDGFAVNQVDCIDLPIAAMAGSYSYNNFYYYCYYRSVFKNWKVFNEKFINPNTWLARSNFILEKLGLILKPHTVNNSTELISLIRKSIDHSSPVFMMLNYYTLYYSGKYQENREYHGTIINGYDSTKSLLTLTDINAVDDVPIQKHMDVYPLYTMYLKESILQEIWEETTDFYKSISSPYLNTVFTLEKIKVPEIESFSDLIADAIQNNILESDYLLDYIDEFNNVMKSLTEEDLWLIRNSYVSSLNAFFKSIEKSFLELLIQKEKKESFNTFKKEYIDARSKIVSILIANKHRGLFLDNSKPESLKKEIRENNNILLSYLYYFNNESKKITENVLYNYALTASVQADSAYVFSSKHVYRSSFAVDGLAQYNTENYWSSDYDSDVHWLKLDLKHPVKISKYVIKHHGFAPLHTKDFHIQSSNDGVEWKDLFSISDNSELVTTLICENEEYRYYRLLITRANSMDNIARIYEFELWG